MWERARIDGQTKERGYWHKEMLGVDKKTKAQGWRGDGEMGQ